jgi:hypothetical protein
MCKSAPTKQAFADHCRLKWLQSMEVRDCTESHELQILSMKFQGLKIVRSCRV